MKTSNEARHCFIEEIKQNELVNKKYKNVCLTSNYIKHLLNLVSTVTGCFSIKSIIKKKKKKHNKIVLLTKVKVKYHLSLNLQGFNWLTH